MSDRLKANCAISAPDVLGRICKLVIGVLAPEQVGYSDVAFLGAANKRWFFNQTYYTIVTTHGDYESQLRLISDAQFICSLRQIIKF